ncbi:MAG TPA: ABC transporter ATP-binding protein [Mycobacteriales bacterium]|nr:ABC transporter ATP-binding protein [Mycobacteriales bacterium]
MTTSPPAIEVRDLCAAYGRIQVLHGVSFAVPTGTVVALLGPNGAGKSTTLKCISGQLRPTSGHVHIGGHHLDGGDAPDALARAGMCTVPEGRGIFPNLSVNENLRLFAYAAKASEKEIRERTYAQFPRLAERRTQLAGRLSGGEQQMLAMSRALATDPGVLLLDELSMGLAPKIVEELYAIVSDIARHGVSVLVVEQFARRALAVAQYGVVMVGGRVTAVGEPEDIRDELSAAYLGGAA